MNKPVEACPICGSRALGAARTILYVRCDSCGHEIHRGELQSEPIVNDALDLEEHQIVSSLDRFKIATVERVRSNQNVLIDIGAGSGKFLHLAKKPFPKAMGLEVSPLCVEFAKKQLGLDIVSTSDALEWNGPAIVTSWHSLEHIPAEESRNILDSISHKPGASESVLIISVPNADSTQHRWFGELWPYFDPGAHVYQFSSRSLDLLLKQSGYSPDGDFPSAPYSGFGYLQGFMNLLNPIRNYYYYRKKRGFTFAASRLKLLMLDLWSYVCIALFMVPSLALTAMDRAFPKQAGVITRCYRKNP